MKDNPAVMRMIFKVVSIAMLRPHVEAIIPRSLTTHMTSECTISEEMIAVFGAIPSGILIYVSVYYDLFPCTASQITYVLAIAIGGTIALHLEALRLTIGSRKI
jgi:hypothetical protein